MYSVMKSRDPTSIFIKFFDMFFPCFSEPQNVFIIDFGSLQLSDAVGLL